jgi:hypothetical protein
MDDPLAKKRCAPILTRDNWHSWFSLVETFLKGKKVGHTLVKTVAESALVPCPADLQMHQDCNASADALKKEFKTFTPEQRNANEHALLNKNFTPAISDGHYYVFNGTRWVWDQERKAQYEADEATAWYSVSICLDDLDLMETREKATMKEKWQVLKDKYMKIRPATNRELLAKISQYSLPEDTTISSGWVQIREYRRRLVESNPKLTKAYGTDEIFEYFLAGLPDDYDITRQNIDAQPNLDVDDKLDQLYRREDALRIARSKDDTAMAARRRDDMRQDTGRSGRSRRDRSRRRNRSHDRCERRRRLSYSSSSASEPTPPTCYDCGRPHKKIDCPCSCHVENMTLNFSLNADYGTSSI